MDYKALAYTVTETEKSRDLPSTCWRSRKAGDAIQLGSKGLKMKGADGENHSPEARKDEITVPQHKR